MARMITMTSAEMRQKYDELKKELGEAIQRYSVNNQVDLERLRDNNAALLEVVKKWMEQGNVQMFLYHLKNVRSKINVTDRSVSMGHYDLSQGKYAS